MTRPITHNNALRLSLSPITRAPRSLTPPSLAAATRRLVVPNALLDTVPKGTRRQGGSGRRSARLAMLLRSCGWSGRVQEAGRMGGGTRTCAKHGRTRSLRRFEFKTFPADRPVCNTSGSGDACGHPHRQGQPRGRRGDAESRGRGSHCGGRWRCFVNGCGVESTLELALLRAGGLCATVIRNLVACKADPLSQSVYLSPREIPIRESHFVSPPRVNVAQKRRLRKIGGKVAAAGCCMWERIPRGSAEHQWFGDCTFCAFQWGSLPAHVQMRLLWNPEREATYWLRRTWP